MSSSAAGVVGHNQGSVGGYCVALLAFIPLLNDLLHHVPRYVPWTLHSRLPTPVAIHPDDENSTIPPDPRNPRPPASIKVAPDRDQDQQPLW